jgi:hypothetical protein
MDRDTIKGVVWTENYRPRKVKDVVSVHTERMLKYLEDPSKFPNFLFFSRMGGTGKTSMVKAVVNDLGCDVLELNGSSLTGVDVVRFDITTFIRGQSLNGGRRCVVINEFDRMSGNASDALKDIIEEYSSNVFFLLTTNRVDKISHPLRSRFVNLEFSLPCKEGVKEYLKNICRLEGLDYSVEGLERLVGIHYPSVRNMVNCLQDLHIRGLGVEAEFLVSPSDEFLKLFTLVRVKDYVGFRKSFLERGLVAEDFVKWLFGSCMKGFFNPSQELLLVQSCARMEKGFSTGADPLIVFMSEIITVMKHWKEE